MLIRGFSLLEMLFALALTSMLIMGIMTFYPKFQLNIIRIYHQNRLEETVNQGLSGVIKDIKRAGFIANELSSITEPAININLSKNCIIIRYDSNRTGKWRNDRVNPKNSDIFVYRYYKNNLEYQTGSTNCKGSGWEKLFDANEVKLDAFQIKQYRHYVEIKLTASLKKYSTINYSVTQYVKTENQ